MWTTTQRGLRATDLLEKLKQLVPIVVSRSYVPVIGLTREPLQWAGSNRIAWDQATIAGFDLV